MFIVLGLVSLAAAVVSIGLKDPGVGKWDTAKVREVVAGHETTTEDVRLGFFEVCRRLFLIPTVKRILTASAVLGMFTVPLNTFFFFFLEQRWGLGPELGHEIAQRVAFDGIQGAVRSVVPLHAHRLPR